MAGDDQSQHVNMLHHHEIQGVEEDGDIVSVVITSTVLVMAAEVRAICIDKNITTGGQVTSSCWLSILQRNNHH